MQCLKPTSRETVNSQGIFSVKRKSIQVMQLANNSNVINCGINFHCHSAQVHCFSEDRKSLAFPEWGWNWGWWKHDNTNL